MSGDALKLEIKTPNGVLRAMLRVPPNPMRLPELAASFMGFSGKLTDESVAAVVKTGKEISCKKGCGACCRQAVPLSPPEAWMIADLVAAMPEPRQSATRKAFAAADLAFAEAGIKQALMGELATAEHLARVAVDYFRVGVACPFLVDESCSIHPFRPSICREYLVTSPAENCARLGLGPIERVPVGVRLSEALSSLTSKLLGKPEEVVPLVFALEWAEAHKEDGARTFDPTTLIQGLVAELSRSPA